MLPIGGVKEKLLAAHRMGLRTVILPRDNEKDLADVPPDIQSDITVKFVEMMDEVLQIALEKPLPAPSLPGVEVAPKLESPVVEREQGLTN